MFLNTHDSLAVLNFYQLKSFEKMQGFVLLDQKKVQKWEEWAVSKCDEEWYVAVICVNTSTSYCHFFNHSLKLPWHWMKWLNNFWRYSRCNTSMVTWPNLGAWQPTPIYDYYWLQGCFSSFHLSVSLRPPPTIAALLDALRRGIFWWWWPRALRNLSQLPPPRPLLQAQCNLPHCWGPQLQAVTLVSHPNATAQSLSCPTLCRLCCAQLTFTVFLPLPTEIND